MRRYHGHSMKNLILRTIHKTYLGDIKTRFQYTATQISQITKACCQEGIGYARYKTGSEEIADITARMIIQAINKSYKETTDYEVTIIKNNLAKIYNDPKNNINLQTHMNVKIMNQIKNFTPQLWGALIKGYIEDEIEDLKTDWTTSSPTTDDLLDQSIENDLNKVLQWNKHQ